MFQIEPILWLQSFESPVVTWVLSAITKLGYTPVYIALVICLVFGLRLRPGLSVLLALLIAGILTDGLKSGLTLPRPSDIDARVVEPGHGPSAPLLDSGGASSFWALPPPEAISAVRAQSEWSYGFPSGHVGTAAAFFLGLALFFRSRGVLLFSVFWIPLMALSRMYLGRHFVADVLAGLAVGAFAVVAAALLVHPLNVERPSKLSVRDLLPLTGIVLPLVILTPFIALLDAENVGRLLGLLVAYSLILLKGLPSNDGKIWQRLVRVLTAIILYIAMSRMIDLLMDSTGWEDRRLGALAAAFLLTCVTLAGTVAICRRLRCYVTA
ncbi:MAG: phosphatase PAP2 family protein [bacterium]|nr:MAG: phosphatase PAP2 family protein [bacterium]